VLLLYFSAHRKIGALNYEYGGKITTMSENFARDCFHHEIQSAAANGGWSAMDYTIHI
jgi:hypothetical protein